jgi:hypothetical protein
MIRLNEDKKTKDEIVVVKQVEKKKTLVWVNSIEPKPGHNLYEFTHKGDHFTCTEINISSIKPAFTLTNVNGKWVNVEQIIRPTIDFFNPEFKAVRKGIAYKFNPEAIYLTALNYRNACKRLRIINPHLFQ